MTQHKDLIDTALAHRSIKERARVLDLVRKMGVSEEDDFWLIFIAIGQLQVLVEDTPVQWQDIFDDFREYLESWSNKNIKLLSLLKQQSINIAKLDEDTRSLLIAYQENLTQLTTYFKELSDGLLQLNAASIQDGNRLDNLQDTNTQLLTQMSAMSKDMTAIKASLHKPHRTSWWLPWGIGAMLFMNIITSIGLANAHNRLDEAGAPNRLNPQSPSQVTEGWVQPP